LINQGQTNIVNNRNENRTKRVYLGTHANIITWTNGYSSTGHHPPVEKKDIFKILMTVQGPNHNTGEIATIVSVNGGSRVKLFDDYKTFYKG
jgi:hypothetical protein